jgi:TatD DNase family protein
VGTTFAYPLADALYLNLTSACTLACTFCPKIRDGDYGVGGFDLKLDRDPGADEVMAAANAAGLAGRSEVVFTGFGEPTRRLAVLCEVTRRLKAAGIRRVRLDTDGLASLREGRDVIPELAAAGLDAVHVSLNAADPRRYVEICPNRYGEQAWHAAKDFIRSARGRIPEVKASAVAMDEGEHSAMQAAADELGVPLRWRPYDRIGRLPVTPSP